MKRYNILIVEDDLMIGDLLKKILQREEYNVRWMKEGKDIIDIIHEMDLVIMDVMLPGDDAIKLPRK